MAGERILIVDDNSDTVSILSTILKRGGYAVSIARDGEEALQKAEEERPALMLLDLMMPRMDGFEVCRQIRSRPALRGLIIFFLSAKADPLSKSQAIALEVSEYILKPFTPREIIEKVRYHLSAPEPPPFFLLAFLFALLGHLSQIESWTRLRAARRRADPKGLFPGF